MLTRIKRVKIPYYGTLRICQRDRVLIERDRVGHLVSEYTFGKVKHCTEYFKELTRG